MPPRGYIQWTELEGFTLQDKRIVYVTMSSYGTRNPYEAYFLPYTQYLTGTPNAYITNVVITFWTLA